MRFTPIPKRFRWTFRRGILGLVRVVIQECIHFFKHDPSQFGECEILHELLTGKSGLYVDIGSGRPIKGSNTFALYKRGWRGLLVDPIPMNKTLSRLFRPRDEFFLGLIGRNQSHNFFLFEPYAYSTIDSRRAREVMYQKGDSVALIATLNLPAISLQDLFKQHNILEIDFLNIDIEGVELEVLATNDWNLFVPRVICAEILDPDHSNVVEFLQSYGYFLVGNKGPSHVFQQNRIGGGGGI